MPADVPISLVGLNGEPYGSLRTGTLSLVAEAEERARNENLAKPTAITKVLATQIEAAGYQATSESLREAQQLVQKVRRGELVDISIVVQPNTVSGIEPDKKKPFSLFKARVPEQSTPMKEKPPMPQPPPIPAAGINFFEMERVFPNPDTQKAYESLIGLDDHKQKLLIELEMLLYPQQVEAWSKTHHGKLLHLLELSQNRVPLILFEGDVGTGKTMLAETIGDALARRVGDTRVHLLKLNTQVRGTGLVGEMSDLIARAFSQAETRARKLAGEPVLLLIDEADALAASRETQQMHHEDKAGLNTILQRLDNLRLAKLPIAVLFITNRPEALDPAVRRRAALDLHFERPDDAARLAIIGAALPEIELTQSQLNELKRLTGEKEPKNQGIGFTASDITDRLLPGALRTAYTQKRALVAGDIIELARQIIATPKFGGNHDHI